MKKRLLFSLQYALFCAFTMFLMITVYTKHYQFDSRFFVPLIAAFIGPFLAGWFTVASRRKRFRHTKIGLAALVVTFLFSWIGFWFHRISLPGSVLEVSALKALADAWLSFADGAIIMVPAFVLLTYLAEGKKDKVTSQEDMKQHQIEEN
jgi:hypothetical protein